LTITLGHALLGIVVSGLVLCGILLLTIRSTRRLFPVRCVHCWMYNEEETVITLSEEPDQWGICPDCVELYWHFSDQDSNQQAATFAGDGGQLSRPAETSLIH
jgi:hypothetical protein